MRLLFYKGLKSENPETQALDQLICLGTRSRFSHVELAISHDNDQHVCWSSSGRDGGVRCKVIDTSSGRWEIVDIDVDAESLWLQPYLLAKYDYPGLLCPIIGTSLFSSPTRYFCSEFVADVLGHTHAWAFSPEDLYKLYHK